ncbi:putative reverse transcriptase domain-containing protein [Tanacetum coccineum]
MESELWNLKVKEYDITAYTAHFNKSVMLCPEMVPTEKKKIMAYIRGLSKNIKGEVTSSSPTTLNRAIRMAHTFMEKKRLARVEKDAEVKKIKWENFQSGGSSSNNNRGNYRNNNRHNQNTNRRQGNARYPPKCNNYGRRGNKTKDYQSKNVASGAKAQLVVVCYECGERGHKSNACLKRADRQGKNARDKSFMDIRFNHLIDIKPVKLNTSYEVELADKKVVRTNTVLKGCTLNLLDYLFDIDPMPIELGTFDVIVGMDWLVERDAVIMCGKKEVHVPYKNKKIVVKSDTGASRLKVISCIKASKYIERGSLLFLAQVTEKEPTKK